MPAVQTLKNHTRFDPSFHFFVAPIALINVIVSIVVAVRHWSDNPYLYAWYIVMSVALFLLVGIARSSAIRAQDRIIRLEERLRLAALLPAADLGHINELTVKQLIALRFASDAELPALVRKTLTQNLEPKAIKQSIVNWRGDYDRV